MIPRTPEGLAQLREIYRENVRRYGLDDATVETYLRRADDDWLQGKISSLIHARLHLLARSLQRERERAFHEQRRMFAIRGTSYVVLAPQDAERHEDWLSPIELDCSVRGYVDRTGIYFYRGLEYETDEEVEQVAERFADLAVDLGYPGVPVYAGVVPGEPGKRWPPRKTIREGTVHP